jgi:NADH-quinone oxidoreductase subunit G
MPLALSVLKSRTFATIRPLGADGNCRMCLVGIEDGRPPLVPACKTRAVEGMKVQLDTEKIKKIQHDVMELELINHPIDCPICDQAGRMSIAGLLYAI